MSYTYLQEQGAVSSVECFSDISQFVQSNLTNMQENACLQGKEMEFCHGFQSGMMLPRLMQPHGEEKLTLFVGGSPAKISAVQEKERVLKAVEAGCGNIWQGLFVKYDQSSSLLKTHHCLWEEVLPWSSVILPQWGMMQDGEFLELLISVVITCGSDAGYWPTPLKEEGPGGQQMKLTDAVAVAEGFKPRYYLLDGMEGREVFTGKVNPDWVEWLMGWPIGWTNVSQELEMDKFQQWRQQHGLS